MLGRMKREHRRFSLDKKKYRRAGSTWKRGEDSYLDFPCVKMKISECKFWERPNWPEYRDLFPNSAQQLGPGVLLGGLSSGPVWAGEAQGSSLRSLWFRRVW